MRSCCETKREVEKHYIKSQISSMFGDTNHTWVGARSESQKHKLLEWLHSVSESQSNKNDSKLVILEIGCGTSLHSISIEAESLIADDKYNATLIRINPNHLNVPKGHICIGTTALYALQQIAAGIFQERPKRTVKKPLIDLTSEKELNLDGSDSEEEIELDTELDQKKNPKKRLSDSSDYNVTRQSPRNKKIVNELK